MVTFTRVLKKIIFRGEFRTPSNVYEKVFLAEVVNVFQPFTIFVKKLHIAVRHNPKYASDIFLTIFTAEHLDCFK